VDLDETARNHDVVQGWDECDNPEDESNKRNEDAVLPRIAGMAPWPRVKCAHAGVPNTMVMVPPSLRFSDNPNVRDITIVASDSPANLKGFGGSQV
jgi:hypothetical protein